LVAKQSESGIIEKSLLEEDGGIGSMPKTEDSVRVNRQTAFGIVLTTLLASVLGVLAYNFYNPGKSAEISIPSASFDYIELTDTGNISSSSISPDGKFVAFLKNSEDRTNNDVSLHLMELETTNEVEIKIGDGIKPGFIKFSPDGKWIFFRTRGKPNQFENVYKVSLLGGDPELIAEGIWGLFDLSGDGTKMAYFGRDAAGTEYTLIVRDIVSGVEEVVFERPANRALRPAGYPAFSPDGQRIAYLPFNKVESRSEIAVISIETRKEKIFQTKFSNIYQVIWNPDGESIYINAKEVGSHYQIWNLSYPEGSLTRVTSDSNAYRSLDISNDGKKITANRLNIYSNVWFYPGGETSRARQLTKGENEIGGLLTIQFMPGGKIVFNAREGKTEGMWVIDAAGNSRRRLTKQNIGTQQNFSFSKSRNMIFLELEKTIWTANLDGANLQEMDLGEAVRFSQPAVSPDEEWLYYVKRNKEKASIFRRSLENSKTELVTESDDYSPDTFLSISPDGRYLAFVYVNRKKIGDDNTKSDQFRKFGFLDLADRSKVKVIEVSANRSILRWTEGGKSFDFKAGSAIFRKKIDDETPAEKVFELEDDLIYRFDWSPDGKDLAIGRGKSRMDLVLLNNR
jgi:Tol biopolymer transport system component